MNPYRVSFYSKQSEWHGYADDPQKLVARHSERVRYFTWYTKGWLPQDKNAYIADLGCGAGQFVYFLRQLGYTNVTGVDIDKQQVQLARDLELPCTDTDIDSFLCEAKESFDLIVMLDIVEHLTMDELHPIMTRVSERLRSSGKIIVSVPNAEGPTGMRCRYADLTHENAYSIASLSELFFCHGLSICGVRDPYPAPVSVLRKIYRGLAIFCRKLEAIRLRLLGLGAPAVWSPVMWAVAEKKREDSQ